MWTGRNVLITGSAAGIGLALSQQLLEKRATVIGVDRDRSALEALAEYAQKHGWEFVPVCVDITDREALHAKFREIELLRPRIHAWVNNAGASGMGRFLDSELEDFDRVLSLNLTAVVCGTRLALRHMEQWGGGLIVNMASVAGFVPAPFLTAYSATKHAVVGFTRALQEELRLEASPVGLLLVSPGFVDTPMIRGASNAPKSGLAFPAWLQWMTSSPDAVAKQIVRAMENGRSEISPTLNGKLMRAFHSIAPQSTRKMSKVLLTKSPVDLLLGRYSIR